MLRSGRRKNAAKLTDHLGEGLADVLGNRGVAGRISTDRYTPGMLKSYRDVAPGIDQRAIQVTQNCSGRHDRAASNAFSFMAAEHDLTAVRLRMSMRNAIFYLTYNGLYNFTNGIGTQTQLLIGGFEMLRETLIRRHGPIDRHVVCPAPDRHTWGYDHAFFQRQQERLAKLDGYAHLIPYKQELTQDLWEIRSWEALCQNVAPLLHTQTAAYERSLIICVDQPWLQTPYSLEMCQSLEGHIDMLLVFYSTAFIRGGQTPVAAEVAWEQEALEASRPGSRVAIADVCPSSASHLKTHFRVPAEQFAPYTSSILADSPAFVLQDDAVVRATLDAYASPLMRIWCWHLAELHRSRDLSGSFPLWRRCVIGCILCSSQYRTSMMTHNSKYTTNSCNGTPSEQPTSKNLPVIYLVHCANGRGQR